MNINMTSYSAYFNRKSGSGSDYNYELAPLIKDFSFYEFFREVEKRKKELNDYGGFLIITNKQYIIGYNAGFGVGTHLSSFARTMKDITGGGNINLNEAVKLNYICDKNYITARLCYEHNGDNEHGRPLYGGVLNFNLSTLDNKITPKQFENFVEFYNDYNEDIKYCISKYGINNFYVRFTYLDETGKIKYNCSNSLDNLYNYLSNSIDHSKEILEESIIIGKERKHQAK